MLNAFQRSYSHIVFFGLITLIWFAALNQAAHDLWAASVVFGGTTGLAFLFCLGRSYDQKSITIPVGLPWAFFLFSLTLSLCNSFDVETTYLEAWGWFFSFVIFLLFANVADFDLLKDRFFTWSGLIAIPLALHCLWQRLYPPTPVAGISPTVGLFGYGYLNIPLSWFNPGASWTIRYGHWEIHASLINSVILAGFILYWVLFYWTKAQQDRRWLVLFLACISVLGFARSWWSFVILFLGFGLYYRFPLKTLARSHVLVAVVLMGGGLLLLTSVIYLKTNRHMERPADQGRYQSSGRWYYYQAAGDMVRQSPWTGVGLGGFATAYPHFKKGPVESTRLAHSFPLQILTETGIVGFLALLILGVACFRASQRRLSVYAITLVMVLGFSLISINLDFLLNKIMLVILTGTFLVAAPSYRVPARWLIVTGVGLLLISAHWLNLFAVSRLFASGVLREQKGDIAGAESDYKQAIALESFHADSYWRLAQIYTKRYQETQAKEDQEKAQMFFRQALRYKKDIRFHPLPHGGRDAARPAAS